MTGPSRGLPGYEELEVPARASRRPPTTRRPPSTAASAAISGARRARLAGAGRDATPALRLLGQPDADAGGRRAAQRARPGARPRRVGAGHGHGAVRVAAGAARAARHRLPVDAAAGRPFDTTAAVITRAGPGRRRRQGRAAGEYCTGWVKRGPIGVIGTNKSDAAQTISHLLDDLERLEATGAPRPLRTDLREVLRARGHAPSTLADWRAIDAAELALGADLGHTRTKLATWHELLDHVAPADRHVETGEVCAGPLPGRGRRW